MRPTLLLAGILALAGCSLPITLEQMGQESPPPELGRPAWIEGSARFGAFAGGIAGGIVSIVTLPVTWPISLLAEEPLGYSREEFLWAPVGVGAGLGHVTFGAPLDVLEYSLYRAWTHSEPLADVTGFSVQAPPQGPMAAEPAPAEWAERAARLREAQAGGADVGESDVDGGAGR